MCYYVIHAEQHNTYFSLLWTKQHSKNIQHWQVEEAMFWDWVMSDTVIADNCADYSLYVCYFSVWMRGQ